MTDRLKTAVITVLLSLIVSVSLFAHHGNAAQRGIPNRLGEIVADPIGRRLDPEIAAHVGGDSLREIRPVREIAADQCVG